MKKSSVFKPKRDSISGESDLIELPDQVEDECLITKVLFYKESQILRISSYLLMIITLGISYLFSRWFLWFRIWLFYVKTNLKQADNLLITSKGHFSRSYISNIDFCFRWQHSVCAA